MVLISIRPFALRKIFLVIVAFLCFSAFCFADPVLMVHRYSSHPEGSMGIRPPVSTWNELAGDGRNRIVDRSFADFELADLAELRPGSGSDQSAKIGLSAPAIPFLSFVRLPARYAQAARLLSPMGLPFLRTPADGLFSSRVF